MVQVQLAVSPVYEGARMQYEEHNVAKDFVFHINTVLKEVQHVGGACDILTSLLLL